MVTASAQAMIQNHPSRLPSSCTERSLDIGVNSTAAGARPVVSGILLRDSHINHD
jgi:hypothetical protein